MLAALTRSGAEVVYSSELVPAQLRVEAEPHATTLVGLVEESLAAKGLQLLEIAPGHYAVTSSAAPVPLVATKTAAEDEANIAQARVEIVVYGSRYSLDAHGLALPNTVSREQAEQSTGTNNDVLRAAQTLPGVATAASSLPYVRGSLPEDVLVSFDHVAITDPFHLQGFQRLISVFDSSAIRQVDIYTGAFPVRYGTRAGGVIEITPRTLAQGTELGVNVGTQAIGASAVGHEDGARLDWLLSLRDNSIDLGSRAIRSSARQSHLFDFIGRVRWQQTDAVSWTAGALTLNDHIHLRSRWGSQSATGDSHATHFWLTREQALANDWQSVVVLDSAREEFLQSALEGYDTQVGTLLQARHFDTWSLNARWFDAAPDRSGWDLGAGAFLTDGDDYYSSVLAPRPPWRPPAATLVPIVAANDSRQLGTTAYGSYRTRWRAGLVSELGLRFDAQNDFGQGTQMQWSPRLNVQWQALPRLTVNASMGRFSQAQRPDEWRLEAGQVRADPAQLVNEAVIGAAWTSARQWQWRFETYRKRWLRSSPYFDNLFNPQGLTPGLSPDRIRISPDSSSSGGVELSVQRDVGQHLRLWGNGSSSKVSDEFGDQQVLRSWDQRWSANLGLNWSGPRFNLAAVLRTHQGWPRTPLLAVPSLTPGAVSYVPGSRNSSRWGTYASADVRASWLLPFRSNSLELWAEVTNLANRGNPCCMRIRPGPGGLAFPGSTITWQQREIDVGLSWRAKR